MSSCRSLMINPSEVYLCEVLDDLSSRFILNLPVEELSSSERVCFQAELAYWFYEDFYRDPSSALDVSLPLLPPFNLKSFIKRLFAHVPILAHYVPIADQILNDFIQYKIQVPVCGAILINPTYEKCLMVKGWNAKSCWSFPKGKINEDESETSCGIREAEEEIGFDITPYLNPLEYIDYEFKGQPTKLYLIRGVPESTPFAPQTRKEISDIAWHSIEDAVKNSAVLHKRYFPAMTALYKLREWIRSQNLGPRASSKGAKKKKKKSSMGASTTYDAYTNQNLESSFEQQASLQAAPFEDAMTEEAQAQAEIENFLFSFLRKSNPNGTTIETETEAEPAEGTKDEKAQSLLLLLKKPPSPAPLANQSRNGTSTISSTLPPLPTHRPPSLIDTFIKAAKPASTHSPSSFLTVLQQPKLAQPLPPISTDMVMQTEPTKRFSDNNISSIFRLSLPAPSLQSSLTRLPPLDFLTDALSYFRKPGLKENEK